MKSAFGVDHGDYSEIEKFGFGGLTRLGSKLGEKAMGAGIKVQNRGASLATKAKKPDTAGLLGQKNTARLGEGHLQAGGALHRIGTKMAANPLATGGIAAGGMTAGGAGLAGGLLHRNKQ